MRQTNHNIQFLICSLIIAAGPLFGAVKMQVRDGHPIVDGVYVNGNGPYRFLVDTGRMSTSSRRISSTVHRADSDLSEKSWRRQWA